MPPKHGWIRELRAYLGRREIWIGRPSYIDDHGSKGWAWLDLRWCRSNGKL